MKARALLLLLSLAMADGTVFPHETEVFAQTNPGVPEASAGKPTTGIIHGTVDVVISTREGFVLATDSRATKTVGAQTTYSDDAQKLFPVGNNTACVIAGLVGSQIGASGFEVRDALGTSLGLLDRIAKQRSSPTTAFEVAGFFASGLSRVSGLLNPNVATIPSPVAQLSAVSMNPDGSFEWISFDLPVQLGLPSSSGQLAISVGTPLYRFHSTYLGARFDVDVLGQPEIAQRMLGAKVPATDRHSRSAIMRRYYRLKKEGRLDQFRLSDGILLARELVQATIDRASQAAGVGGPIDIATVTTRGIHWVQRKNTAASFPPPHPRVSDSSFAGSVQILDGLECVRCDFTDARLFYVGSEDVQLIDSKFGGACRLTVAPDAERRRPEVVARLKALVRDKCEILVQNAGFP